MTMELIDRLISFPVVLTAAPFALLMVLMIISLVTGLFDGSDAPVDSGTDSGADADADLNGEAGAGNQVLRLLVPAGFSKYPLVVALTVALFFTTSILYYADGLVSAMLDGWARIAAEIPLVLVALYAGLHLSLLALKPLEPLFDRERVFAKINYIGMRARICSNKVTPGFGQAMVTKGGIENQIEVHCDADTRVAHGDSVIIVSYDNVARSYRVIRDA